MNSAQDWNRKANELTNEGQHKKALENYQKAVDLDKTNLIYRLNLGNSLLKNGYFDGAIQCFLEISRLEPDSPIASKARIALNKVKKLKPHYEQWNSTDGSSDNSVEKNYEVRINEVKKQTKESSSLNSDRAAKLNVKGNLMVKESIGMAIDYYLKSLQIDPYNESVWTNLGNAFLMRNFPLLSIKCYDWAIKLNPFSNIPQTRKQSALKKAREYGLNLLSLSHLQEIMQSHSYITFNDLAILMICDKYQLVQWIKDNEDIIKNFFMISETDEKISWKEQDDIVYEIESDQKKGSCGICKGSKYSDSDPISYCTNCDQPYHLTELVEWIRIKAFCPVCKHHLDIKVYGRK